MIEPLTRKMSRASQLPPRIPLQRKGVAHANHELNLFNPPRVDESRTRHRRSFSQSSTLEDQPAWLDDLLSDSDPIPKEIYHCRSASDSATLFHGVVPNMILSESSRDEEHSASEEDGYALESACVYGANSPRRISNVEFSQSSVLMALSDYVSQNPVKFAEESQKSRTTNINHMGDCCISPNELNSEPKTGKRHPGQRSRARKLEYIAELERTVNVFEALESELAIGISTLIQQKAVLSTENSKLRLQMARLQQQKLLLDGEYQILRKEAERLKLGLASSLSRSRIRTLDGSRDTDPTKISWQMLDWKRLQL